MLPMTRHAPAFLLASLIAASLPAQAITWWGKDFDAALTAAKDKPTEMVLLYCWQDDHLMCQSMFDGTMADKKVIKKLDDFICMGLKNDDAGRATWQRYKVASVPAVFFIAPDGAVVDVLPGYVPIEQFAADIDRIRAGTDTIPGLRKYLSQHPEDVKQALKLVQKLRLVSDIKGSHEVINAMIKVDPKGKSEEVAEAMLWKISDETFGEGIAPQDYDLEQLRRFLKSQRNKRVLFLGYDQMATAHYRAEDIKSASSAAMKAWKNIPKDQVIDWGQRMCGIAYRRWKDLDKVNKRTLKDVLAISKKTLAAVEARHKKQPDVAFLGSAMYLHAAVLIVNKQRKKALTLMDEAIKIDPNNKNLGLAKENWVKGNK
ncbi:MAG: tetratricopeptide (TPR) repeat protein [Planctomycetota bacterium]|jgi:tetratricopeptide (TPR) repeat protein